ncbi:MAG: phosphatidate cytidylyltransferase [Mycoplasmoidaceae bacterium]
MPKTKKQIKQRKQTFLTRTRSAIVVASFYVIYLLLLFFSNRNWFSPIAGHDKIQFILNFFNVLMIVPIIYFVAKEISDLCFPGHKAIFYYTASALFILTMGASIFLLGTKYNLFSTELTSYSKVYDNFTFFLIISLSGIVFFTLLSTLVWIIMSRHIVYVGKKTRIWFPLLVFILNTFFVGFVYTTVIHTWTTYLFLMSTSVLCDVFAYVGGSIFGKHKMAPTISPKKTWEGVLFGVGVTLVILCAIISLFYFIPGAEAKAHSLYCFLGCQSCELQIAGRLINLQPYYWAIYIPAILVIMVVSIFGDLFFSYIKRRFNVKDFSNLIPGHGGILDRLDALIFTFTFYFLLTVVIQLIMIFGFGQKAGLYFLWHEIVPNFAL